MNLESDIIALEKVSFAYPSAEESVPIVQNLDLSIRRGEWLTLVGSNGSGKSTLAKLISKLFAPTSGRVVYKSDEQPFVQLIFQNPDMQIIGETVGDDLSFGMDNFGFDESARRLRAAEVLETVGLTPWAEARVSELSGGQKQLLAIAGGLAVNPAVLVFDEATSMLDPASRAMVRQAARALHRQGKTVVWITQWLDELADAERVAAMQDGVLVFDGTPREFFYGAAIPEADKMTDPRNQGRCAFHDAGVTPRTKPQRKAEPSCCERLGFIPPYTVQVAKSLLSKGHPLHPLPVSPEELAKAVSALCP